jgi:hypothetical protein
MSEQDEGQEQTAEYRPDDVMSTPSNEVQLDLSDATDGQVGDVGQSGGFLETLKQPRVRAGVAGGLVSLATSGAALVWLQRRRSDGSAPSSNGVVPGRDGHWTGLPFLRRTRSRPPTIQDRMTGLAGQGRERARRVGAEMATRAGQIRPTPAPTGWQAAGARLQGSREVATTNRFTLAALAVAVSLLGAARWLDRQQTTRRGR